jgi:hypothetical protein
MASAPSAVVPAAVALALDPRAYPVVPAPRRMDGRVEPGHDEARM